MLACLFDFCVLANGRLWVILFLSYTPSFLKIWVSRQTVSYKQDVLTLFYPLEQRLQDWNDLSPRFRWKPNVQDCRDPMKSASWNVDPEVKNKLATAPHTSYSWEASVGSEDRTHHLGKTALFIRQHNAARFQSKRGLSSRSPGQCQQPCHLAHHARAICGR